MMTHLFRAALVFIGVPCVIAAVLFCALMLERLVGLKASTDVDVWIGAVIIALVWGFVAWGLTQ